MRQSHSKISGELLLISPHLTLSLCLRALISRCETRFLNPALGLPESQPTCGQLSLRCTVFNRIYSAVRWFAEQTEPGLWLSSPGSGVLSSLGEKSKVRILLVCPLPACSEITHLPQSVPCVVSAVAWPPQSCSTRKREETGRGWCWWHLFLEKSWISHQSNHVHGSWRRTEIGSHFVHDLI